MDSLSAYVLHCFDIKAKKIAKEKSYYICSTSKGLRVVRKSFDTSENIAFHHHIKECLFNAGFTNTDRFYLSREKKPFVEHDGDIYVMTDFISYKEADFSVDNDFKLVIKNTGYLHKNSINGNYGGKILKQEENIIEYYLKSLNELTLIRKKLSTQKRLSDFDVIFLKNYNFYVGHISNSIDILEKTNLKKYISAAKSENKICHSMLKEENLIIDGDILYILNFSKALVGYGIFDLASIIQRYIKVKTSFILSPKDIIKLYNEINPLEIEEINILYPLLIYPEKFVKLCLQYYSKKRTWTPNALTIRMENIVNKQDDYYEYLWEMNKI